MRAKVILEVIVFYNLNLEVISPRSKCLGPAQTQGEKIEQVVNIQKQRSLEAMLETNYLSYQACFLKVTFKNLS